MPSSRPARQAASSRLPAPGRPRRGRLLGASRGGVVLLLAARARQRPLPVPAPRARPSRTTRGRSRRRSTPPSSAPATWRARSPPRSSSSRRAPGARCGRCRCRSSCSPSACSPPPACTPTASGWTTRRPGCGSPSTPPSRSCVAALWRRQERVTPAPPGGDPAPAGAAPAPPPRSARCSPSARRCSSPRPATVGEYWPWPLTPLLGQAVASWYALVATALLVLRMVAAAARGGGHPLRDAARPGASCCSRCRCCTPATSWATARLAAWIATLAALVALAVFALARAIPAARAAAERL